MFEVGAKYEFRVIEDGDQVTFTGTIENYDHPLIKLVDTPSMKHETVHNGSNITIMVIEDPESPPYPGKIINVISPAFVSAVKR